MNKFLVGVLIVLFLVFFAEIRYLFYGNKAKLNDSKTPTINVITPSPTAPPTEAGQALSQQSIDRFSGLKIFKKGVLQSTTVKHVLEGKITAIKKPSEITGGSTEMANFTIEGKEGLKNSFFFSEKDISNMKIFQDLEKKLPMSFDSLKVGDNIDLQFDINIYNYEKKDSQAEQIITIIINK